MNTYIQEFELAKKVALEVGEFLSSQTIKKIDSLEGKDIKLELDRKSEEIIVSKLEENFNHSILSEEMGLNKAIEDNKVFTVAAAGYIDATAVTPADSSLWTVNHNKKMVNHRPGY